LHPPLSHTSNFRYFVPDKFVMRRRGLLLADCTPQCAILSRECAKPGDRFATAKSFCKWYGFAAWDKNW
jgi:hypothetical protein